VNACDTGGHYVGGYCWYEGLEGQNCTTVCAAGARGGYNADGTLGFAGSGGTDANCQLVLDEFGYTSPVATTIANAFGCSRNTATSVNRRGTVATTESSSDASYRRMCACNAGSVECTPGATRCNGSTFETCNAAGYWATTDACTFGCNGTTGCYGNCNPATYVETCPTTHISRQCVDYTVTDVSCANPPTTYACQSATGLCGGVCTPGVKRCSANGSDFAVQICTSEGQWNTTVPVEICDFGCDASDQGAPTFCFGECTPLVDGDFCTDDFTATSCVGYFWVPSVCTGQACVDATGQCGGVCVPQTDRCSVKQYQYCDGDGAWVSPAAGLCPFGCDATLTTYTGPYADACYGVCNTGNTRCVLPTTTYREIQACDGAGLTWGTISNCANACVGDVCGGVCIPGQRRCTTEGTGYDVEVCNSSGQWDVAAPVENCSFGCDQSDQGAASFCYGECLPGSVECVDAGNERT